MADKRAIKVDTLDRLAEGFQESRGITHKLTTEEMIELAKVPTASGENKFTQLIDGTITELTAKDFEGVTKLRYNAFANCEQLKIVYLPNWINHIGSYCFNNTKVENVYIDDLDSFANIQYGTYEATLAYSGKGNLNLKNANGEYELVTHLILPNITKEYAFSYYSSFISATIPDSVTETGDNLFNGCPNLESVSIGSGLTKLSRYLFLNCKKLSDITIPNNITKIETSVFLGCEALVNLTIPSSVVQIERRALEIGTSSNKATITFLGTTPPTIESNTIGSHVEKILVLKGCGDVYKSATNFSAKADIIEEGAV